MYIYIYIYTYQTLSTCRMGNKVNFLPKFNRFEFRVFLSPRLVALIFTPNWRENSWKHIFPKGISAM